MPGTSRKLAIAHGAQFPAQGLPGDDNAEFLEDPLAEIDDPPPHNPMNGRDRAALDHRGERGSGRVIETRRLSRSLPVDQSRRTIGVEFDYPIANDLKRHHANLGRLRPAGPLINHPKRQKPPSLWSVLALLRPRTNRNSIKIGPERDSHGEPPSFTTLNQNQADSGITSPSRALRALVYIAANPGGYSYSRFCELYRSFEKTLSVTMRQTHAAGERLFVDYAGDGVPVVIDRLTGEIRMAQIFVAALGASSFTFAKATWTQALPDWIDAHVRAFETIGGVPELVVPDNARTAIVKASFYDPQVNRTYAEMAAHYGTAILPARPRKPRDKAKVEQAVLIVERWLLGRLRRRTFTSLADVDAALGELMTQLNERQALRWLGVTHRQLLEEIDRPALNALPDEPYEYSEWRISTPQAVSRASTSAPAKSVG